MIWKSERINPADDEELALTLAGKKKKLKQEHCRKLGFDLGMTEKQIQGIFRRFEKNKAKAMVWIGRSFLSTEMKIAYNHLVDKRYLQIGLV